MPAPVESRRVVHVGPQPGPQTHFLESPADIVIAGGAAGGGKTHGLLLEPMRHVRNTPAFGGVIFRRSRPQITNEGGLWDSSMELYPLLKAKPRQQRLEWVFPHPTDPRRDGATIRFAQLQHNKSVQDWKSSELPFVGYDQLEDFTEFQFWYMMSRLRSTTGIRPYVRGTANPDPDSFLRRLLSWWIDEQTGYAIPSRSGKIRWFVRVNGELHWGDEPAALCRRFNLPINRARSLTFIPSTIHNNPLLQAKDPGYLATLESLPLVERERLLGGNWNIRPSAGKVFNRAWWGDFVRAVPAWGHRIRYWDKASTVDGDYTVGVLMQRTGPTYYVLNVVRGRWSSGQRMRIMKQVADLDMQAATAQLPTDTIVEEEGGSAGKDSSAADRIMLAGHSIWIDRPTGSKYQRAQGYAAQVEAGNVRLVVGRWNEPYIDEHQAFPTPGVPDDQVDAGSGAFNRLALRPAPILPPTTSHAPYR